MFITGGAAGIGYESARQLLAGGHRVALVDRDGAAVAGAAAELGEAAIGIEADVTSAEQLQAAAAQTAEHFGGIDVSFANAGLASLGPVLSGDRGGQQAMIDVNLTGVLDTIRATAPYVIERRGYVLVMASAAAALHIPLHGVYAATKAGVEALANALRSEVRGRGVAVGVSYFMYIQTPMVSAALDAGLGADYESRLLPPLNKRLPVDRAGTVIVEGIERRAKRIFTPRLLGAMLPSRMLLGPAIDLQMRATGVSARVEAADLVPDPSNVGTEPTSSLGRT